MNAPAFRNRSASRRLHWIWLLTLIISGCAGGLPIPDLRPKPIADRPIDIVGRCVRTEEDGFREDATLRVVDGRVEQLQWRIWVGKRGSCSFALADFRQIRSRPHVELQSRHASACRLLIWQEPRRVTMAHVGCESQCTPGIYGQAWPVLFDTRTGACSDGR